MLTTLHAGGKFGDGGGYKVSGGLHGVGVSVVNALSERLHLEVRRDGHVWTQDYERGDAAGRAQAGAPSKETGTTITFLPDPEIFEELEFDFGRSPSACARRRSSPAACASTSIDERGAGERESSSTRAASSTSSRT